MNEDCRKHSPNPLCLLLIIGVISFPSVSFGVPIGDKYCSNGGSHPDGLSTSDMTYSKEGSSGTQTNATDCYGIVDNNDENFTLQGGNMSADDVNALWGATSGAKEDWGSTDFALLAKDEKGESEGFDALGYFWTLDGQENAQSGLWTLTATPLTGLPAYFDFVGILKGTAASAAYLFDEALYDGDGGGTWTMQITAGKSGNPADLSNFQVFGRVGTTTPPSPGTGPAVPVPAPLALLGLGGLALAWTQRRSRI